MRNPVFNRSGLAALSDLASSQWREAFVVLEAEQDAFLAKEPLFRSEEYQWPRDPLHTWSRAWEYPYVYYHLKCWREQAQEARQPQVIDIGSGVTFFPFAVAKLGYHVLCTDVSPVCGTDLNRATNCIPHDPGRVEFRPTDGRVLPFEDGFADIVYCISVLEHIPSFETAVLEITRVLKPGGLLLLTIDVDLQGNSEIGVQPYKTLMDMLARDYVYACPDRTIHPMDMLVSSSGPYPLSVAPEGARLVKYYLKNHVIKPLVNRVPRPLLSQHLAVQGFILRKRP